MGSIDEEECNTFAMTNYSMILASEENMGGVTMELNL
jgi:hypothetical protein